VPVDVALVLGLSTGVIIFAFRQGSTPEKLGAVIVALNMCIDLLVRELYGGWDFTAFSSSRLLIDVTELGLLLALALSANRVWPIFSAATQMVAVAGNLAAWGTSGGMQLAYWAVTQMPLFGQIAALAVGTYLHVRRQAVVGRYRDWRIAYSSRH
jgi:hypothetical protein